ncbi:hypothetical protein [Crocosphaera sp. Alani8]|uniref:hypothetical protein n=1 Tax=Crocosphaera sp. Alani8 TaxID=3038952 RepID=UPI00313E0C5B
MVNPQDDTKQSDSTLKSSQANNNEAEEEGTNKKNRLKFEEKDMYKIKLNF